MWKRGEIAPKEQFLLFSTLSYICIFLTSGVKLHIHLLNMVVQFIVFLTLSTLIYRGTDISKCFSESLGIRDNESRLYFPRKSIPLRYISLCTRICWLCWGLRHVNHCVSFCVVSQRKGEKEKRDSREDEREGQGRSRKMNESEETVEVKPFPLYPHLLNGSRPWPTANQYQLDAPVTQDTRHFCLALPTPTNG